MEGYRGPSKKSLTTRSRLRESEIPASRSREVLSPENYHNEKVAQSRSHRPGAFCLCRSGRPTK